MIDLRWGLIVFQSPITYNKTRNKRMSQNHANHAVDWLNIKDNIHYDTKEISIERLIAMLQEGLLRIESTGKPTWNNSDYREIIELILLGLPLPTLVMSTELVETETQSYAIKVVEGSILIEAITSFVNNSFVLQDMKDLCCFNGLSFEELPVRTKRFFLQKICRIFMFDDMSYALKHTVTQRYYLFHR